MANLKMSEQAFDRADLGHIAALWIRLKVSWDACDEDWRRILGLAATNTTELEQWRWVLHKKEWI
jgi:hypothetical protein